MRYFLVLLFLALLSVSGCKRRSQLAREAAMDSAKIQYNCDNVKEISSNAVKMTYKLDVCGTTRVYRCDLQRERNGKYSAKCSEIKK